MYETQTVTFECTKRENDLNQYSLIEINRMPIITSGNKSSTSSAIYKRDEFSEYTDVNFGYTLVSGSEAGIIRVRLDRANLSHDGHYSCELHRSPRDSKTLSSSRLTVQGKYQTPMCAQVPLY